MKEFKKQVSDDIRMIFWTLVIFSIIYIQGLGIQLLLESVGIKL
jgi:hypothetical protein